jgi:hypothetical protein
MECGETMTTMTTTNDHLVFITGESATGKSFCLHGLKDPKGVIYLNTENGKKLPFKSGFQSETVTDPKQVPAIIDMFNDEKYANIHTIVIDSATYLLDMFESLYVLNSNNTMKAWGDFANFWKSLMHNNVAKSNKNIIFTAHTLSEFNDQVSRYESKVPVKGSLKNNGLESYFSCVMSTKKVSTKELEKYSNDLLTITDEEQELGFKYVFQTKITRNTVGERIRGPHDLFSNSETYIDNNLQLVLDRLHEYYAPEAPVSITNAA